MQYFYFLYGGVHKIKTSRVFYSDTISDVESSLSPVDVVQSGNMKAVTSNAVATQTVRYIGNAQGKTLAEMFNTYSKQNTMIYKGYLDWNDNRCPLYGQGADTVEITCYDWNMVATNIKGVFYTYDDSHDVWVISPNLPKVEEGTLTIPSQTLQNTELAIIELSVNAGEWYNGKLTFENIPFANITVAYNDYSGNFYQYFATQGLTDRAVLFPIGKVYQNKLRMILANYTGSTITIPDITVLYQLEHHKII